MKVDLFALPPALPFGEGAEAFKLHLRPLDSGDSAMLLDAVSSGSYSEMFHAAGRLVIGWEGVDGLDGIPIPFEVMDEKTRRPMSRFGRFVGAIPMVDRLRILAGILAFCGIPQQTITNLIEQLEKIALDLDPTQLPAGTTKSDASGS